MMISNIAKVLAFVPLILVSANGHAEQDSKYSTKHAGIFDKHGFNGEKHHHFEIGDDHRHGHDGYGKGHGNSPC